MHIDWSDRFWSKCCPEALSGCWLWSAGADQHGYGIFAVSRKSVKAHRYAWSLVNGPVPEGLCICHRCDVPSCVNPAHLFLGTVAENNADRSAKGRTTRSGPRNPARGERNARHLYPERTARGERCGASRLTAAEVVAIREQFSRGVRKAVLARSFGVGWSTVGRVVSGASWKHV